MKSFLKEFRDFAIKGNLIEVAVGLVLALAFTALVNSLVENMVTPIIAAIVGAIVLLFMLFGMKLMAFVPMAALAQSLRVGLAPNTSAVQLPLSCGPAY